jgi:hypothetical protein
MITSIDLIAAHMVGDYILQTDGMAKKKLTDERVRFWHVVTYCVPFFILLEICGPSGARGLAFLASLFIGHFVIDSRRWASAEQWKPKPILMDQTLHAVHLTLISHAFLA